MTTKPLTPGQRIAYRVPDTSAVITVQRVDNGLLADKTFSVTVEQGPHRPAGWTCTYADETLARFEATRAAHLFKRYRTADAIDARAAELATIREEQQRRKSRRMHNAALLAEVEAELDTLMTLGDNALLCQLRADMEALYTRAA